MSNTTRGYYLVFEHVRGINGALNPQIRETFKALTKTLYSEKKKNSAKTGREQQDNAVLAVVSPSHLCAALSIIPCLPTRPSNPLRWTIFREFAELPTYPERVQASAAYPRPLPGQTRSSKSVHR